MQQQTTKKKQRIPWWVSIIAAVAVYCSLKYVVPGLKTGNQTLQNLFGLAPTAAPVLTIPFLLLAAKQLYDVEIDIDKTGEEQDGEEENKSEEE